MAPAARAALAVLALAAGLTVAATTDGDGGRQLAPAERAVTIATISCAHNRQATSSGFVVADELVVTVAHALYESADFAVRDATGEWYRARINNLDVERDLATLVVPGLRATTAVLGRADAEQPVEMVDGAASGSVGGTVERRVNIRTDVVGSDETSVRSGYELMLEVDPGDSGAGVVDADDRLVAIIFARSTRRLGASWSISVAELPAVLGTADTPEWDCGPGFGNELNLEPPEPERLAG